MEILWCITGAGHFLDDSCKFMHKLSEKHGITVAFSGAGYEVVKMYGLLDSVNRNSKGIILEREQGFSSPVVGRLAKKEYDLVLVSPCTANTVAKVVNGIADSLVSNIVAQAVKSKTPVYVLPTDVEKVQETEIPIMIDPVKCMGCKLCPPMEVCPTSAFFRSDKVRINLLKCNACKICIEKCEYEAISFGKKVKINIRDVDLENTKKLRRTEGIKVVENLNELNF